jgi:hypothetical protein
VNRAQTARIRSLAQNAWHAPLMRSLGVEVDGEDALVLELMTYVPPETRALIEAVWEELSAERRRIRANSAHDHEAKYRLGRIR